MKEEYAPLIKDGKLNWVCLEDKCPKSCCGPFDPLAPNLRSLLGIKAPDIILTPKDLEYLNKDDTDIIEKKFNCYFLKINDDGSCPLLECGLCTIYERRTSLCRAYPFTFDFSMGLCIDSGCPGVGKGWTDFKDIEKYIDACIDLFDEHEREGFGFVKRKEDENL